jgi:ATPase MipZ
VPGTVDPVTYSVTGESHYSEMVRDVRRRRRQADGASTDWIVVRNRLSMIGSRNKQLVASGLKDLSLRLGFRSIDGFAERVVYREFFPRGLTALDDIDEATLGTRPGMGGPAANRAEWFSQIDKPLQVHDIFFAPEVSRSKGSMIPQAVRLRLEHAGFQANDDPGSSSAFPPGNRATVFLRSLPPWLCRKRGTNLKESRFPLHGRTGPSEGPS